MKQIKVLIIDDSAVIKEVARELLSSEPDILTLDVEIPKMDGLR
jgi:chemotaxis response regulator CheB